MSIITQESSMLLQLLTVAAMLIGGWVFAAILSGSSGSNTAKKPNRLSLSPDNGLSLWSLILLLFFPSANAPQPSQWSRELD